MYNCEKQIPRVLEKVSKSQLYPMIDTVLIIDNVSKDASLESAKKTIDLHKMEKALLVQNKQNVGLGGSHKAAFNYAKKNGFDFLIVLHGDDQGDVNDFAEIIQSGMIERFDAVLGSRFSKGSKTPGYSTFRIFGNRTFNLIFSFIALRSIHDLGAGLNCYRVKSLNSYEKFPDNLVFNVFMLMKHLSFKEKIMFHPIAWREEDQISNVKMFSQALQTMKYFMKYLFRKKRFLLKEHRETIVKDYAFNTIHSLEKKI